MRVHINQLLLMCLEQVRFVYILINFVNCYVQNKQIQSEMLQTDCLTKEIQYISQTISTDSFGLVSIVGIFKEIRMLFSISFVEPSLYNLNLKFYLMCRSKLVQKLNISW